MDWKCKYCGEPCQAPPAPSELERDDFHVDEPLCGRCSGLIKANAALFDTINANRARLKRWFAENLEQAFGYIAEDLKKHLTRK